MYLIHVIQWVWIPKHLCKHQYNHGNKGSERRNLLKIPEIICESVGIWTLVFLTSKFMHLSLQCCQVILSPGLMFMYWHRLARVVNMGDLDFLHRKLRHTNTLMKHNLWNWAVQKIQSVFIQFKQKTLYSDIEIRKFTLMIMSFPQL